VFLTQLHSLKIIGDIVNKVQEIEYKKIKEKLADREYRIGLDLGVGSIGYAVVSLKKYDGKYDGLSYLPEDIILAGSRIFKSSIGAVERREFRLQRNSHRHHRENACAFSGSCWLKRSWLYNLPKI
jgi:CRISPR-associated endonuclease Csn1